MPQQLAVPFDRSAIHRIVGTLTEVLTICAFATLSISAGATEGGGGQYPIGIETQFPGVMAPPGFHDYVYVSHYDASHSKDNDGNDNARLAYFDIQTYAIANRMSYVWPGVTWLGANVETRGAIAFATIKTSIGLSRPSPLGPLDRSGSTTGMADPSIWPVILGWHAPTVHQQLGVELAFPLGTYDAGKPVNAGRNYYAIAPGYAVTWFPKTGWDVSARARYAVNAPNSDTHYHSGNEVTLELGTDYRVNQFLIGASGYAYVQTTADKQNGNAVIGNGNKGRVFAFGPSLTYIFAPKIALVAKIQSEFGARNRSEGTRFWLQLKLPFAD